MWKVWLSGADQEGNTIGDFFAGSGTTLHAAMELNKDGGHRQCILVTNNENICQLYDYDGKRMLRDLVIANVMRLEYEEYVNDDVFTLVTRQATCFCYTCDTYMPIHYGLMSPDGKLLTKPIFSSIQAITRDLYLCQPGGVLLNSRGEEI